MRILVVNVNTSQTMTSVIEAGARRYASAGTQIIALQPYFGAEAVDCNFESYLSAEAGVAVGTDHAEVICLGCAGMAGAGGGDLLRTARPRGGRSRSGRPAGRGDHRPRPEDEQSFHLLAARAEEDHRLAALAGARPAAGRGL